jgi:hypothetical protein
MDDVFEILAVAAQLEKESRIEAATKVRACLDMDTTSFAIEHHD